MIRPATLADVRDILGIVDQQTLLYPKLRADRMKILKNIKEVISTAKHFCWVSCDRKVTGVIVGITNENMWAQRQSCNIVIWVTKIPGDGVKLLQELRNWIRSRRAIKVAGFAPDTDDIDPRVWKLVEMLGFKRCGGAYLFYN